MDKNIDTHCIPSLAKRMTYFLPALQVAEVDMARFGINLLLAASIILIDIFAWYISTRQSKTYAAIR